MNKRIGLVLVIALLSIVLIGLYMSYLSKPSLESKYNFLQDDPCKIPCWENIVPGESSELSTLKSLLTGKLIDGPASYLNDNWLHFFTQTGDEVSIFFLDGMVHRIEFNPDSPLLLSTIIDKLGEPEKIHTDIVGEHEICHVSYLYYPRHGLRIETGTCEDFNHASRLKNGNVMSDTPVLVLSFVEVSTNFETMMKSFDLSEEKLQEITKNMVDWKGYGYYSP